MVVTQHSNGPPSTIGPSQLLTELPFEGTRNGQPGAKRDLNARAKRFAAPVEKLSGHLVALPTQRPGGEDLVSHRRASLGLDAADREDLGTMRLVASHRRHQVDDGAIRHRGIQRSQVFPDQQGRVAVDLRRGRAADVAADQPRCAEHGEKAEGRRRDADLTSVRRVFPSRPRHRAPASTIATAGADRRPAAAPGVWWTVPMGISGA